LQSLLLDKRLKGKQAENLFRSFFDSGCDLQSASSALILLRERGETAEELSALCQVIRERSLFLKTKLPYLVDNCGTGGDRKGTFNISTLAALVAAGAGASVAKHGNRSSASGVGSSDILEALGVTISAPPEIMLKALRKTGIGYFHAPLYHPLMQKVRELRKAIKGRTIFNLVGPLLNPLNIKRQVIGVSNLKTLRVMAEALSIQKPERAFVVCGHGGMDEITPYGQTAAAEVIGKKIRFFRIDPPKEILKNGGEQTLKGGTVRKNRAFALGILRNEINGVSRNAILLNAAVTLIASGRAKQMKDGLVLARASLDSGSAFTVLKKLVEITNV